MPIRFNSGATHVGRAKYQLIIDFRPDDVSLTEWSFADKSIFVKDWGSLSTEYNEEDFWLVTGTYRCELIDAGKWLYNYMYRDNDDYYSPRAKVELYKSINDTMILEFSGYFLPTEISYDDDGMIFSIVAAPRMDILNNTAMWYDKQGVGTIKRDSGNYKKIIGTETKFMSEIPMTSGQSYYLRLEGTPYKIDSVLNDSILYLANNCTSTGNDYSYDIFYASNPLGYTEGDDILLQDLITDIFKMVTPALTGSDIIIKQHWQFAAWSQGDLIAVQDIDTGDITQYNDVDFGELKCLNNLYIFDHTVRHDNLSALLKQLCLEYGCYAGMTGGNKAFFAMLYNYLDTDCVEITREILVAKPKYYYAAMPLEYVRFYSDYLNYHQVAGAFSENADVVLEEQIPNAFFLNNRNARSIQTFSGLRCEREHNSNQQDFYIGLAKDPRLEYPNAQTSDPYSDILVHLDYEEQMRILADIHYRFRTDLKGYFSADFKLIGTDYTIYNMIKHKDEYLGNLVEEYYQPVSVEVNYQTNLTTIRARRVKQVD